MRLVLRNVVVVAVLFAIARFVLWGRLVWADALINDRIFTVYFGWLSTGMLLSWAFPALVFACIGSLVVLLRVRPRPTRWALGLGAVFGLDMLVNSTNHFAGDAPAYVYLDVYAAYLMPALGAGLGAWATQALARRVASTPSL